MDKYNQVKPLNLHQSNSGRGDDTPVLPGVTNSFTNNNNGPEDKGVWVHTGQSTASNSYTIGYTGFKGVDYGSTVLQQHYSFNPGIEAIPKPTRKGNFLSVSDTVRKPDYSLFFPAEDTNASKPPGLVSWIDRQYARALKEKFSEVKMQMFISQANKLIAKAYASGKEWQNDWFQQPPVPVFSRGGTTPPMQLLCEKKSTSSGGKRKGGSSDEASQRILFPESHNIMSKSLTSSSELSNSPVNTSQTKAHRGQRQTTLSEQEKKRLRLERFSSGPASKKARISDEEDYSNLNATSNHSYKFDRNKPVVGRCKTLEKQYLRLTSEPDPEKVRPLPVLGQAYQLIIHKYKKEHAKYAYVCDQFKSIRQDLKVQIIENDFTLKVYQTHARIALMNGDLGEYNQCQGSINELFESGNVQKKNFAEFISYRVLYNLLTEDHAAINEIRLQLYQEDASLYENSMIKLALDLATAQYQEDYHSFMKMYAKSEGPMRCLLDQFIKRERLRALKTMCCAYNQLKLTFLVSELHLQSEDETFQFLNDFELFNAVVLPEGDADTMYLNFKECRSIILNHYKKSMKVDIKGQK
ncbi:HDL308Wp [Eremothecium sinecaudum]|uniref:HDL308Wp n=1 Tax=Eremothecium sinecaudum TaxID=45286 RepID=A0A0X8HS42_9SACH|nr:HDL308Wp [Eremothecium sinecaudum]AMD20436.1 HDL308Wp [Eremothecium sinecaudum]